MKTTILCCIFLGLAKEGYGAADFEVERVSSPYVESRDVGQMMQSENTQHMMRKTSTPYRSYSTYDRRGGGCLTCHHGMDGAAGSDSSSSYSSSSYSHGGMGTNPVYSSPPQSSSSRHEFKKEKEFVNGQQVYDFHHEKKYQDGRLIDESRHEKTPEDFSIYKQPGGARRWSSYSSWSNMPSSSSSASESHSSNSNYHMVPQTSHKQHEYQESRHAGYGLNNDYDDHVDGDFDKEVERMREELRRNTLSSSLPTHLSNPTSGGSHRSEFRKETKYVNGKPVYKLNEERKYKDGKLIHNVRDEKGPEDLGTTDALSSSPVLTYPTGEAYSRQNEEIYKSQSQHPVIRYPVHYRPSTHTSSSESSSTYTSSHQQPYYRPSDTYSSERVQEQKETQSQSQGNYYPNSHYQPDKIEDEDSDDYYRQPSYHRPDIATRPTTTTSTTTPNPSYVSYDASPKYNRIAYNPRPASSHSFEEQSSSTHYTHSRPADTPRYNYNPESTNSYRPYDSRPDSEEKIREASESSYYDLTAHKKRPVSDSHQEPLPSYTTGTFSTFSENRETETSHHIPSQENRVIETSRSHQPGAHVSSPTQEEQSRSISSRYYPTNHNAQRPRSYERERDNNDDDDITGVGSPRSNYGMPGFISGPESEHNTASEEEEERYDISPYDGVSEVNKVEAETDTNTVQFENHSSQHPDYKPQRLPEPDRLTGSSQRGYSVFNTSRTDHITKVLPSRWMETKTTWKYLNGKLVSETQHHRYYENGILVHENSTRRTRDELQADGIDVLSLDLTASQLSEYGPAIASTSHSQKHEMHQIKRFKNGQQIYELNHERRFQDGKLVHDDRDEKDEDDFGIPKYAHDNHQYNQARHFNRHSVEDETGLYSTGALQTANLNPQTYSRKHELRQQEEFVNGQKVYNLHHEREYHDGKLIRENKTELGPEKLGTQRVEHRDAMKDLLSGHTQSSVAHNSLLEQQRTADSILKTSCITCRPIHESSTHSQGRILSSMGIPATHGYKAGSSYRQDMNVEEHYENGQLVKGREAKKKWRDGQLIDAKEEHYYDGPSRANISTNLATGFSSSAATSAFSAAPIESAKPSDECSYNPCKNKGTCKESVRGSICICVFGFKGTYCEEAYCPNRYCRYGGTCSTEDGQHVCGCLEGYSGYRCSTTHHKIRVGVSG